MYSVLSLFTPTNTRMQDRFNPQHIRVTLSASPSAYGLFLESLDNFSGAKSKICIKTQRIKARALANKQVLSVLETESLIISSAKLLKPRSWL